MGTVEDQPALTKLGTHMPVGIDVNGVHVTDAQGFPRRWSMRGGRCVRSEHVSTANWRPRADCRTPSSKGMESPFSAGHTMVVIAVKDHSWCRRS